MATDTEDFLYHFSSYYAFVVILCVACFNDSVIQ